jgi:hypothetical protein
VRTDSNKLLYSFLPPLCIPYVLAKFRGCHPSSSYCCANGIESVTEWVASFQQASHAFSEMMHTLLSILL